MFTKRERSLIFSSLKKSGFLKFALLVDFFNSTVFIYFQFMEYFDDVKQKYNSIFFSRRNYVALNAGGALLVSVVVVGNPCCKEQKV